MLTQIVRTVLWGNQKLPPPRNLMTITLVSWRFSFKALQSGNIVTSFGEVPFSWKSHCPLFTFNPTGKSKLTSKTSSVTGCLSTGTVACIFILFLPTFGLQDCRSSDKVDGETCNNNNHGHIHTLRINQTYSCEIILFILYIYSRKHDGTGVLESCNAWFIEPSLATLSHH